MKTQLKHRTAEGYLGHLGSRIDDVIGKIQAAEKTEKLRSDIAGELKRLNREISVARARIDEDLADSKDALATALRAELDVWKGRLEDLRVRASLGRMEVRDRVDLLATRLDSAILAVHRDLEEMERSGDITAEVRGSIERQMRGLRNEIESAEELA